MNPDPRNSIYQDLHQGQLSRQEEQNRHSALEILTILREYLDPQSVLDVGCGLGTWLSVAQGMGIQQVFGVEGPWLDRAALVVDQQLVQTADLENPFSLGRRFDLVICLEIAEHLASQAATNLVGSLAAHGECVLFSAAIPFQGGHHHVNEQFPDYWAELFARHAYYPLDLFRARLWKDSSILWWLRQNILLFAHEKVIETNEKLRRERDVARPLSIVHPDVYLHRLRQAEQMLQEHQQIIQLLGQGGHFVVSRLPDGRLNITRQPV